ncbi:MAG: LPS assembly lipoprotein LptE [Betaproteobacteria bacterium]|jgi:Rare lipoprotein B|nr:LPS assembly lipoprotein LptE [Betaproteobacteria bacterium]
MIRPIPLGFRHALCWLCVFLSACGFQLRGLPDATFHTLYIDGNLGGGSAQQEMEQQFQHQTHLTLVKQTSQADVILYISPIRDSQQILSLNVEGTVSQYTLYSRLSYRATDNLGNELVPPSSLTTSRVFNYNIVQILGKSVEQVQMTQDMHLELVHQMMYRLLSLHPHTGSADLAPPPSRTAPSLNAPKP